MDLNKLLRKTQARYEKLTDQQKGLTRPALRIATDDRPYDLDFGTSPSVVETEPGDLLQDAATDQGTARAQKSDDQGTARAQKSDDQGTARAQKPDDQGTARAQKSDDQGAARAQKPDDQGTARAQKPGDQGTVCPLLVSNNTQKRKNHGVAVVDQVAEPRIVLSQGTGAAPLRSTKVQKARYQGPSTSSVGVTRVQKSKTEVSVAVNDGHSVAQNISGIRRNGRFDKKDIPRTSDQLTILLLLHKLLSPEGRTPHISRAQIARQCMIAANTVKVSLGRLLKKGLITSLERSYSPTQGGAVYFMPKSVVKLLDEPRKVALKIQNGSLPAENSQGTEDTLLVVSSKDIKTTTTNPSATINSDLSDEHEAAVAFKTWVARLELDRDGLKIGVPELMLGLEQSKLPLEQFIKSLEHIVHYLRDPELSAGIEKPRQWAVSRFRGGFFHEPAGFVSWEEQQINAQIAADENQAKRLRELRLRRFEAKFTAWFEALEPEQLKELKRGKPLQHLSGAALKNCLRENFVEESGFEDPSSC